MAYKVFTNGSTLQASEVNENLMRQSVATFSNAAARTAAITAPVEGQLTYLEDVDRFQFWTGTAWRSPFGLTPIHLTSFSAVSSISLPNNTFTTEFDDYLLLANFNAASASGVMTYRLRASGVDNSSANYSFALQETGTGITTYTAVNAGSQTSGRVAFFAAGELGSLTMTIRNPILTQRTSIQQHFIRNITSIVVNSEPGVSQFGLTNSFDSMTIAPASGNVTGILSVYGYRKN